MCNVKEMDATLNELFNSAQKDLETTEQHRLYRQKLKQMEQNCEMELMQDQQLFVRECFALLREVAQYRERQLYRKGIDHCISLLTCLKL